MTTLIALFCCFENELKKVVFYVGISSVSIKQTEHCMAAWGYEFYLRVLKVSLSSGHVMSYIYTRDCQLLSVLSSFLILRIMFFWLYLGTHVVVVTCNTCTFLQV